MDETGFVYRDYKLICAPVERDDGRFEARVVIAALKRYKVPSQFFLDLETFESEEAAIKRAREAGIDWVDTNFSFL
jgi:hypothetical protein